MASTAVNVLGFIFVFLVLAFFISILLNISLFFSALQDFINYMNNAFLSMFGYIEAGIEEFFDVLYEDVIDLIDELIDDFTPYF